MKKINLLIVFCLAILSYSQAQIPPQAFNYSAVARNSAGVPIATSTIGIQVSILKTSTLGPVQYSENHFVNTDAYGLFNLIIGAGAVQSGSISTINWSADNYYVKVGMDVTGGTNFLTMGTTQLLSVPYALHAATADSLTNPLNINTDNQQLSVSATGDTLHLQNGGFVIIPGISAANNSGGGGNGIYTSGNGVTDIDGNTYSSIIINGQEWMAENLRTTKYANGDTIVNADNPDIFSDINDMCNGGASCYGAWAHYGFNPIFEVPNGKLYNGPAMIDSRNVCPNGWHVSTNDEWISLVSFLDPNGIYSLNCPDDGSICYGQSLNNIAGTKLKSQTGWYLNGNGTNESGFNAVPSGAINHDFSNRIIGQGAVFWTSSLSSNQLAIIRFLEYDKSYINAYDDGGGNPYLSIRCVKD
jgi:uncharacterized protein (TIGR02145 family)